MDAVVSVEEKYGDPAVVAGWETLSRAGLQAAEMAMVARHATPGGLVVDVGCGGGRAGLALAPRGHQVVGVDRSAPMLALAASLHAEGGVPRRLTRADFGALPLRTGVAILSLVLIAGIQHIPTAEGRRQALAEAGRVLRGDGVLLVGVDNLAPALVCYGWWVARSLGRSGGHSPRTSAGDRAIAAGRAGQSALAWHSRGLLRSVRWRTVGAVIDAARFVHLAPGARGDTVITQVSPRATPGRVAYHRYRHDELVGDAANAGLALIEARAGSELTDGRPLPGWVRRRDKQVLYAFAKSGAGQ